MQSTFPRWLRIAWLCLSPLGLSFAGRIAWEKTIWTWYRGPQAVGFSLMHIHPLFFFVGALCCYLGMLWLIPSGVYLVRGWRRASKIDKLMVLLSLLVS